MSTLSAIPIKTPYIDQIMDGEKRWEIRSKFTKKLGPVALIRSGSGTVVATATIADVIKITGNLAEANAHLMGMSPWHAIDSVGLYAWVLKDIVKLKNPVPYKHPYGAITWVTLNEETANKVLEESKQSRKF